MKRRTKAEIYPILKSYDSGELSKQECCKKYSMKPSVFYYWLKKYREDQNPGSTFIKVDIPSSASKVMELEFGGGHKIRFSEYPPVSYVKELLLSEI